MILNIKNKTKSSKMYSDIIICAVLLILGKLHKHDFVEAASSSSNNSNLSESKIEDSNLKPESNKSSEHSSYSTSIRTSYVNGPQNYWTAFINISYVHYKPNDTRPLYHTDKSETGRYSTANNKDAIGVAVVMTSKRSILKPGSNLSETSFQEEDDLTGCFPPFVQNFPQNESWIALVKRGGCTFNEKVKNAITSNASGVMVYDIEDGKPLQSMKVEQHHQIPSIFTYNWKGREIIRKMKLGYKVYLNIQRASHCQSEEPSYPQKPTVLLCVQQDEYPHFRDMLEKHSPFWNWGLSSRGNGTTVHGQKRTSVLFVSVSFIILMLISLAWLIFYYVQRFRYIHAKDQLERKLCSQAKRALQIISTSVLKKDDLEAKDFFDTCAVCIENYRVEDIVRILPCKHQFHKSCIDQWLLEKRTCPMCKMDILKHYGLVTEKKKTKVDAETSAEPHEETSMNQMA